MKCLMSKESNTAKIHLMMCFCLSVSLPVLAVPLNPDDYEILSGDYNGDGFNDIYLKPVIDFTIVQESAGMPHAYSYNSLGVLSQVDTAEGDIWKYVYDAAGQVEKTQVFNSDNTSEPASEITYTYNKLGLLESYDDGKTKRTFIYNSIGQLTDVTVNFGPFEKSFHYTYNDKGFKDTYTNPEGIVYHYTYDNNGNFKSLQIPNHGQVIVNEYENNIAKTVTYPGGTQLSIELDDFYRVDNAVLKSSANLVLANRDYSYDANDNIDGLEVDGAPLTLTYDELDRVTGRTSGDESHRNETVGYDKAGNITAYNDSDNWSYNDNNQLLRAGDVAFTYTGAGHRDKKIVRGQETQYVYDGTERLVEIIAPDFIAQYTYDPFNRRLSKTVDNVTTYYLYSEEGLAAEYDNQGNLIAEYQYWPGDLWSTNPLFQRRSDRVYYYFNSVDGTPQKMFTSTGQVVWQVTYESFGEANVQQALVENNLRLPGQYFDAETGLHYNWQRYYDPSIGRYIQSDPIGFGGGINAYAYGENNPMKNLDVTGEAALIRGGTRTGMFGSGSAGSNRGRFGSGEGSDGKRALIRNAGSQGRGGSHRTPGRGGTHSDAGRGGSYSSPGRGGDASSPGRGGTFSDTGRGGGPNSDYVDSVNASLDCDPGAGGTSGGGSGGSGTPGGPSSEGNTDRKIQITGSSLTVSLFPTPQSSLSDPQRRYFNDVLTTNAGDASRDLVKGGVSTGIYGLDLYQRVVRQDL